MKIYSGAADSKTVRKLAKKIGLNTIRTSTTYTLFKIGAKNQSVYGYPNIMECGTGNVYLAGHKEWVWIILLNTNTWFKTSPILKCEKTENSFYELRK